MTSVGGKGEAFNMDECPAWPLLALISETITYFAWHEINGKASGSAYVVAEPDIYRYDIDSADDANGLNIALLRGWVPCLGW